ncbi:sensor histidine kinase [Maricaulis sp. CAU 1757]
MKRDDRGDASPPDWGDARELLEDAPCGMVVTNADGVLLYANQTLMRWLGRPGLLDNGPLRLPDLLDVPGRIYFETHLAPMLHLQGHVREIACRMKRPGADDLPVLLNGVARADADGAITRVDYTLFDARERTSYETALREARREAEDLAAIVRSSPNAIIRVDARGRVRSWNRGAERLTGLAAGQALGESITKVLELDAGEDWLTDCRDRVPADGEHVFEARLGADVEVEVTLACVGARDPEQAGTDLALIVRNVTARKQAERHLELMVAEMDHRVKNTLSVVSAIARQTLTSAESQAFTHRLRALVQAHDVLTRAHWGPVDLGELLKATSDEAGGADRLSFEGPRVVLAPREATTFAMLLHELVTNALKYGALSAPGGTVRVDYSVEGDEDGENRRVLMAWRESGGPPVAAPTRKGFGSTLIKTIFAREFRAEVDMDYAPNGLVGRIDFPYRPPATA